MIGQTNRRQFLQAGAVASIGYWVTGGLQAEEKKERSKLEQLNFACIGVGGKGSSDTDHVGSLGNLVAICDIDDHILDGKSKKFPKAERFNDFRTMLEKRGKDIDAVVVSTPDHTHAVAAAMAIKMRKHVYCQKPLTHSVFEARQLRQLAREYRVCTQMGNQGTASDAFRTSVELIQSGALGAVKAVHVWTNRPVWPQSPRVTKRPMPSEPPKHVHWDLWLGPAPLRPYSDEKQYNGRGPYHTFNWRGYWDFGTGALGDMACHTANMPYMALKLGYPTAIAGSSESLNTETYPGWAKVVYQFPARGGLAPLTFTWYEGKKDGKRVLPSLELLHGKHKDFSGSGSLIVGEKASLYSPDDYGGRRELLGKDAEDIKPPKETMPRRGGNNDVEMKKEWVEAIKKNDFKLALSNFDHAALLTEVVLLGNVAIRAGKKLNYDGEKMTTGDADADRFLQRAYRTGWKL